MRTIVKLLFILLLSLNLSNANAQTKEAILDSLIGAYYKADCFNGVVRVSEKGKTIYNKAFGIADRELDVSMTTETRFRIASISKSFTALKLFGV